jgi:hypothetical protein
MDIAVRKTDATPSQVSFWNQALLASDANYFIAAAEQHRVRGAIIAWLPRLTHIPAGCVVQNIDTAVAASNPRRWIAETEYACHHLGASQFRLYLQTAIPTLEAALYTDGFVPTVEVAMAKAVGDTLAANKLSDAYIRLVVTRGVGSLGLNPKECKTPTVFVIMTSFSAFSTSATLPATTSALMLKVSPPAPEPIGAITGMKPLPVSVLMIEGSIFSISPTWPMS